MKLSHLLLDLDGVVVLGHPEGGPWALHLERDLGISIKALETHFFYPHFGEIVTGKADLYDRLRLIWHELETSHSPEDFVDYWFRADSKLNQPLIEKVGAWKKEQGGACYLATNQEHYRANYIWETLNLKAYFDGIFYSAELGTKKPDPAYFTRVQKSLGVEASEILFLDDSLANVEVARTLSWSAHHFTDNNVLGAMINGQEAWNP